MEYSSKAAANFFIRRGIDDHRPVDPMKVQKLLYLANGWLLALRDTKLLIEAFEAWPYGPVLPSLYHDLKVYRQHPITAELQPTSVIDEATERDLEVIWQTYGDNTAVQLSAMTHEPGYAWDLARRDRPKWAFGSPTIDDELIRDEFIRRNALARAVANPGQPTAR